MKAKSTPSVQAIALLFIGLCAGLSAGLASAAPDDMERVIITSRRGAEKVHTNVRQTCPGIDVALVEKLGRVQYRERKEGATAVTFRLSGNTISEIRQRGGPFEYQSDIRRAVRNLSCQTDGQDKLYAMQLVFRNEADDDAPDSQRVALVE